MFINTDKCNAELVVCILLVILLLAILVKVVL